ncbi:hypothetical protein F8M41_022294 [Gigaspora margarita]|uniref:Protein kinase domain-containing protein n=1 Tax=Gigaspora margarita TaxID=4874 RepID=A0A8H4AFA8_GIGMA|nr:hypothetical protein F8M41_022294 [Gigaspora margarita]
MVNASSVEDNEFIKRLQDNDINLVEYSEVKDAKLVKIRGYGIVYKGSWRESSIIMKHLPNELTNQDNNNDTLQQLIHKLSKINKINHRNVLKLLGASIGNYHILLFIQDKPQIDNL